MEILPLSSRIGPSEFTTMRVLVTGGTLFFSRMLVQGFARHGAQVTVADSRLVSTGKMSRFTSRRLHTPVLAHDPQGYVQSLLAELRRDRYDLIAPTFEESLLLAEYGGQLREWTQLLLPSHETMMSVHHKPSLYRLCDELAIPAPTSVAPRTPAELEQSIPGLRFPVILKLPAGNNSLGLTHAGNANELLTRFSQLSAQAERWGAEIPLVQETIDGDPVYTLMYCHQGRKLGELLYRPLRTFPARQGTSAHRIAIEHPEIAASSEKLAAATGWTGFLGLDFLVDRQTGIPYLIDANPRPNPGITLGELSGIDWTRFQIDLLEGKVPTPTASRTGARDRSWLLDFAWLFDDQKLDWRWPTRFVGRLRELNAMRPLLTPWKGILKRDWPADLGLWWQLAGATCESLLTGEGHGYALLRDSNYAVPVTSIPPATTGIRRAQIRIDQGRDTIPMPHQPAMTPHHAQDAA
ncbi:MAG: hypothetical protein NT069_16100 [Planctomycetota bacterium]|nr:hypothetical protein [Planctomycetota bacterium]